jgi:hypothetical protein
VERKAYLGSRSAPVKKIASKDREKGMGCRGITIWDITLIIAVNIPVWISFLIGKRFGLGIMVIVSYVG